MRLREPSILIADGDRAQAILFEPDSAQPEIQDNHWNIDLFLIVTAVCFAFTLNGSLYSTSVHPVSVMILHPREIQIMWSQTETEKTRNNRN